MVYSSELTTQAVIGSNPKPPPMLVDMSASTWIKKVQLPCWPLFSQQVSHQRWIWGLHKQESMQGLWNPGQMSPEVQNRGISDPTKGTYVLQKLKNKIMRPHLINQLLRDKDFSTKRNKSLSTALSRVLLVLLHFQLNINIVYLWMLLRCLCYLSLITRVKAWSDILTNLEMWILVRQ